MENNGYQNIKWHKISEGDFPESGSRVLVYYTENGHEFYNLCHYGFPVKNKFSRVNTWGDTEKVDVIAWMEIPEFK